LVRLWFAPNSPNDFASAKFDKAFCHAEDVLTRTYHAGGLPSDMVGIVAAQSIAEPATQMVLNSVTWDTEFISVDGILTKTTIGALYRRLLRSVPKELLIWKSTSRHHLADGSRIATSRSVRSTRKESALDTGRVHRHPVVNEDGSNTVYKVKVRSAEITVTRAKGLLKRINNKIVHATG
jgi:hypothetical protein